MKIKNGPTKICFKELKKGEVFGYIYSHTDSSYYLKITPIEFDGNIFQAVDLIDGTLLTIWDDEMVISYPNATLNLNGEK